MKLPTLSSPLKLFSPAPAQPALGMSGIGGTMMFASSGGGGDDYDPDEFDDFDDQPVARERRPRATRSSRAASGSGGEGRETTVGRPRTAQYQPEERYWTDYLRIALPVIGLLLMIGLLWFWADRLINDDPGTTEPTATEEIGMVTTATPTPPAVQSQTTPPPPANTDTSSGAAQNTPAAGGDTAGGTTDAPPGNDGDAATDTDPAADGSFADGDVVVTTEMINLRPDPSTAGDPIDQLDAGEELTIISGPEEGESYVWWEVTTADGNTGWVVEDFIEAAG